MTQYRAVPACPAGQPRCVLDDFLVRAVARRDAAVADGPDYRAAADEIARIESEISRLRG